MCSDFHHNYKAKRGTLLGLVCDTEDTSGQHFVHNESICDATARFFRDSVPNTLSVHSKSIPMNLTGNSTSALLHEDEFRFPTTGFKLELCVMVENSSWLSNENAMVSIYRTYERFLP